MSADAKIHHSSYKASDRDGQDTEGVIVNGNMFGSVSIRPTQSERNGSCGGVQTKETESVLDLLKIQDIIKEIVAKEIKFSKPLLKIGSHAVLFPNTINLIQGQTGVHKSRLAEIICFVFLSIFIPDNTLGFTKESVDIHLLYADTERNLKDQFPYAIQQIVTKAGFKKENPPDNLSFISLINIPRHKRFNALKEFIEYLRAKTEKHIFIVLDVITDCISDFNGTEDTMQLIDLMNMAINNLNCTFLCVIHENPNSAKARGHIGTELSNKSSTTIQIGFVKQGNKVTDILEVNFIKNRSTGKPESVLCQYSDQIKGLRLMDNQELPDEIVQKQQQEKEKYWQIAKACIPGKPVTFTTLITNIQTYLMKSEETAKRKRKDLINMGFIVQQDDGLYTLGVMGSQRGQKGSFDPVI